MTRDFAKRWFLHWAKIMLIAGIAVGVFTVFIVFPPALIVLPIGLLGFIAYMRTMDEDFYGR